MQHYAKRSVRAVFAVLLTLCLVVQPVANAFATTVDNVTVSIAPLTTSSTALDGMVRVYLSSLGSPTTLTLTIAGSYTVSTGTSLSSGETLTVGFSSTTGAITLTRNGVKTNMGTYFALRRHSASGTNGIKISQARKSDNPYPGDLSFQSVLQSSGSYKLYTVAHIYLENYLYGVLPYEMGSSAAIEALKAQAVAARTYTVRMMNSRSSGYYDVVDTTSDQVYNGTPSGYATCVAAVDATKGIIVKNSGVYTATYYSASNGGQTESIQNIWGSTGYSYLGVKDDPFDYANPDCVVKSSTIYADCTNANNNSSLMALLKTKAVTALTGSGYSATSANTTLSTITNIVAHTPMYASPSKLYTKMDFSLTASTNNSSGTKVSASTTVTVGIFTELESLLSMSIQSSKNELWSIAKSGTTYTLQSRRYGHGLGMSQRGAMYMGKLGYAYGEILGFYYPNSTRVGCTFTNTILAAGSSEEITTEEDAASIDDGNTTDAVTAVVTLISSNSTVAIRASQSTTGTLLGVASNGAIVTVYANDGTWCMVRYGEIVGYVRTNTLTISGVAPETSTETVSSIMGFATVTAGTYLNLRASGSSSASIVSTAPKGAVLTVFSKTSTWAHIQYGATAAYASVDYLRFSDTYDGTVVDSGTTAATINVVSGEVAYLRQTASTNGTVLTTLADGIGVTVQSDDGSWASVTTSSLSGYVLSSQLLYSDETDTDDSGSDDTQTDDTTQTASVTADPGIMRASADASAAVLLSIARNESVMVLSQGTTWSTIRYNNIDGYILTASLNLSTGASTTATVTTQSGSLNMRQLASAGSTILTTIPRGATVTVTSRGETWSAVRYNENSGYVMSAYLTFEDDTQADPDETEANSTATVTTTSGSLNLRQLAKAGSTIVRTIPQQAIVTVNNKGTDWTNVTYSGTTGYVMTVFLTFVEVSAGTDTDDIDAEDDTQTDTNDTTDETDTTTDDTTTDTQTDSTALTAIVSTSAGSLNLRADMLPGSRILTRIPKGTTIEISQRLSAWSQTTYVGYTGYVMNAYLTFTSDADTQSDSSTTITATVTTTSGSLNLRSEPYGAVLATIPLNSTVQVQQKGSTWCYVLYGSTYGYAMTAYLSFLADTTTATTAVDTTSLTNSTTDTSVTDSATATETTKTITATVITTSGSLNLRATSVSGAQILTTIPRLTTVTVLQIGSDWSQVLYNDVTGYVQNAYLRFTDTTTTDETTGAVTNGEKTTAWVYTSAGALNLRVSAATGAQVLTTIPRLAEVTLLLAGTTWSQVQYGNDTGYVMAAYLTTEKPTELTSTDTTDNADTDSATTDNTTSDNKAANATTYPEDATLTAPVKTQYAIVTPTTDADTLTLWQACSEQSLLLLDMLTDSSVQVVRKGDTWCEVLYYNAQGFCLTKGLTFVE